MNYEFINVLALIGLFSGISAAYSIRLLVKGRVSFERVNRHGSSILLSKSLMEMTYWGLQPLAKLCAWLRVTPNQISWSSLALGAAAGVLLAYGRFGTAALIATLSAFMDSLDGMVARANGVASDRGEVLDAAIDRYVEFFFLAGLIFYYRQFPLVQALALLSLIGSFMVSYSSAKAEALHLKPPGGIMRRPERAFYLILGAALSPIPIPGFAWSILGPDPIYLPMVVSLGFVGLLSNISAVQRLRAIAQAIPCDKIRVDGANQV